MPIEDYLGDGVYIKFDGHGYELRANDHRNPDFIYIEPSALEAIKRFAKQCQSQFQTEKEKA